MTNDCEVIDNVACGQAFKYCRTHKVEPHQCPGAKTDPNPYSGIMENLAKVHAATLNKDFQKREFKVGDKVRLVQTQTFGDKAFFPGSSAQVSRHHQPNSLGVSLVFDGEVIIRFVTEDSVEHA